MIELRHFHGVLQYRWLNPSLQASGAWGEPSIWSDWHEVKMEGENTGKIPQPIEET